jgi:tyrosyl-tRNA synthetase
MNIIDELAWRGLIYQVSDEGKVREWFATPGRTLYCGFDPTAPSLHIGNMVPLLALLRFKRAGHDPIVLMGGATGRIGDPSGKDKERTLQDYAVIEANIAKIRGQVRNLFGDDTRVVNNYDWTAPLTVVEFLRDFGKHFTVNHMMAKESVKNRIERDEVGISYTEFSYMLLQALDFHHLYAAHDCRLQIGGSDQWGNITAGAELVRRKAGGEAFALTFPLLTTASGAKFGKSEKGAVYLDPGLTSPWEFFQYWVNADDRDVVKLLKFFTFLGEDEISALERSTAEAPHLREAQRRLAAEMTVLVHGQAEVDKILAATEVLFGKGDIRAADPATLRAALAAAPAVAFGSVAELPPLPDLLVALELAASKGEAKKAVASGGVYLNNAKVADPVYAPAAADLLHGRFLVLRKGKRSYGLVTVGQ